jgi:hypothetical protein
MAHAAEVKRRGVWKADITKAYTESSENTRRSRISGNTYKIQDV